jgi:hypothetical protein
MPHGCRGGPPRTVAVGRIDHAGKVEVGAATQPVACVESGVAPALLRNG